jgi:hypothetical protein
MIIQKSFAALLSSLPSISCVPPPAPDGAVCGCLRPLGPGSLPDVLAPHSLGQPVLDGAIAPSMLSWACWPWNGVLVVYGIEPQSHRAHGERTNGDDYYHIANMLFISNEEKLRVSVKFCASVVETSSATGYNKWLRSAPHRDFCFSFPAVFGLANISGLWAAAVSHA